MKIIVLIDERSVTRDNQLLAVLKRTIFDRLMQCLQNDMFFTKAEKLQIQLNSSRWLIKTKFNIDNSQYFCLVTDESSLDNGRMRQCNRILFETPSSETIILKIELDNSAVGDMIRS